VLIRQSNVTTAEWLKNNAMACRSSSDEVQEARPFLMEANQRLNRIANHGHRAFRWIL